MNKPLDPSSHIENYKTKMRRSLALYIFIILALTTSTSFAGWNDRKCYVINDMLQGTPQVGDSEVLGPAVYNYWVEDGQYGVRLVVGYNIRHFIPSQTIKPATVDFTVSYWDTKTNRWERITGNATWLVASTFYAPWPVALWNDFRTFNWVKRDGAWELPYTGIDPKYAYPNGCGTPPATNTPSPDPGDPKCNQVSVD